MTHSKFIGALDAVVLTAAAITQVALFTALLNPLTSDERAASIAADSAPAVADYRQARLLRP